MRDEGGAAHRGRQTVVPVDLQDRLTRALWEHPQPFMALDTQWRVLYLNAEAHRLVAVGQELVGQCLWDAVPEIVDSPIEAVYRQAVAQQRQRSLEVYYEPLQGWFDVLAVPVPTGLNLYFRNVDERRERDELAHRGALILAAAGDGIYGLDREGRTTFVNPAAEAMLGYAPGELLGTRQHETIHHSRQDGSPYPPGECPVHETIHNGRVRKGEREHFWRKDGTSFPVEFLAVPIEERGEVTGAIVTFSDISDRRQAEEYQRTAVRLAVAEASQHEAVLQLQQAMQPGIPQVEDPELGVHFRAAGAAVAGGDLYDWQLLPDGTLYLAVVDVVGKGVVATRDALAVTHALRLLVLSGVQLGDVVARADELLGSTYAELAATVLVAFYDPPTGCLLLASGGHPPPLYMDGAQASYLEVAGGAIGWPGAGSDEVLETTLAPGASVVFYTDGLVEAKRDVVVGLERLRRVGRELAGLSPPQLARTLVERTLRSATHHDDTLALVLRRRTV